MKFGGISILALLLVGVANSKSIGLYDNATYQQPVVTKVQEHHICAELCLAGLGGEPCGADCRDMIPTGMPTTQFQYHNEGDATYHPRSKVCPVLCENRLGWPLCSCNYTQATAPFFKVNFLDICTTYCTSYNYQVFGCGSCDVYKNMTETAKIVASSGQIAKIDSSWNDWCKQMCQEGEGGSACYCDLLPLSLKVDSIP